MTQPHDPPKPKSRELHHRFTEVHYMCAGMHKRYEWCIGNKIQQYNEELNNG